MWNGKKLINEVKILELYTGIILTRSGQVYQNKNSSELFCSALKDLRGHKIRNENITCLGKAALWIISLHSRSSSGKIFQLYQGIIATLFTSTWAPRIILSEQWGSISKQTSDQQPLRTKTDSRDGWCMFSLIFWSTDKGSLTDKDRLGKVNERS